MFDESTVIQCSTNEATLETNKTILREFLVLMERKTTREPSDSSSIAIIIKSAFPER